MVNIDARTIISIKEGFKKYGFSINQKKLSNLVDYFKHIEVMDIDEFVSWVVLNHREMVVD